MDKKIRDLLEKSWDAALDNWCVPCAPNWDEWIKEIETSEQQALNITNVSDSIKSDKFGIVFFAKTFSGGGEYQISGCDICKYNVYSDSLACSNCSLDEYEYYR